MFRKISIKVAVKVNLVLLVIVGFGTVVLAKEQFQRLDEQYKSQAKFESMVAAKAVGKLFDEAIDNNALTAADAFDTNYQQYGSFDPAKYHTKYDAFTDKALLGLQDEMLRNPSIVFAVTVDQNGYLPTHNSIYQQPITGDKEKDKVGNRTKRIFNDDTGLAAARNTRPGFIQVYKRDTGETMWDVSSPIMVKGKQWGNFRIGLSIEALNKAKSSILLQLLISMAVIIVVTSLLIHFTIHSSLQPLTLLTEKASRMADGDVTSPIMAHTKDEIGDLAHVLEKIRISMKSATERLRRL
ncbi:MAG: HAMP domain-containing protein [Geobacteraceae bacterium]|nr:HAMP domain-containing protein [Geobacteraceae bacterium]